MSEERQQACQASLLPFRHGRQVKAGIFAGSMPYPDLIWHSSLDSTNAEALRALEAGPLPHGWAVAAETQTAGRGQRGRQWVDAPGESLLLSVVVCPAAALEQQPLFSFGMAVGIAEALERFHSSLALSLKWPNDLYVADRKAGGILIENVLRGSHWPHAVVGIGINLGQESLPHLPMAVSLRMATGAIFPIQELAAAIRAAVADTAAQVPTAETLAGYNARLYRRGLPQAFRTDSQLWTGIVEAAEADGRLRVLSGSGDQVWCTHGMDEWLPVSS